MDPGATVTETATEEEVSGLGSVAAANAADAADDDADDAERPLARSSLARSSAAAFEA